jgi:hypothetical protein
LRLIRVSYGFWLCAIQPLAIARVDVLAPVRKPRPREMCLNRVLIRDSYTTPILLVELCSGEPFWPRLGQLYP